MLMIILSSILLSTLSLTSHNIFSFSMILMPLILYMMTHSNLLDINNTHFIYFSSNMSSYLDFLSFTMTLISLWLLLPMINSMVHFKNKHKSFSLKLYISSSLVILISTTFLTSNSLIFYIMFESTILPTIMLILIWGYQPERLNAFLYMTLYTIIASLPLILSILNMSYLTMFMHSTPFTLMSPLLYFMSMLAFLVKIPLYSLHMWLPKAHVEAPIEGSMILAAILLKLGSYGLIRFMIMNKIMIINYIIMIISLVGAAITTLICIQQTDAKSLIAYSSVAHMGLGTAAILTNSSLGKLSGIIMLIAHGLISPILFYNVNTLYELLKSRSIFLSSGIKHITPIFSMYMFMALMLNSGVPPSMNFMSELLCLTSVISLSSSTILPVLIMTSFSMVFSAMFYIKMTSMAPLTSTKFISPSLISSLTPLSLIPPAIVMSMFLLNF